MEIDDYLHWPLIGAELTGRIRGLLKSGVGENSGGLGNQEIDSYDTHTFVEMGSIVDRFTDSLSMISQALKDIRQEPQEGMAADLSDDLMAMAAMGRPLWFISERNRLWRATPPPYYVEVSNPVAKR